MPISVLLRVLSTSHSEEGTDAEARDLALVFVCGPCKAIMRLPILCACGSRH